MKRVFNVVLAGLVIGLAACSGNSGANGGNGDTTTTAVDTANAAAISFDDSEYDFGKIKDGEKVVHEFKFTNTGKSPLIISNAMAGCGCTVPEYPQEPIPPGESAAIKVVYNSAGQAGLQNKVITLTTNAVPSSTMLRLIGEVQKNN